MSHVSGKDSNPHLECENLKSEMLELAMGLAGSSSHDELQKFLVEESVLESLGINDAITVLKRRVNVLWQHNQQEQEEQSRQRVPLTSRHYAAERSNNLSKHGKSMDHDEDIEETQDSQESQLDSQESATVWQNPRRDSRTKDSKQDGIEEYMKGITSEGKRLS
jgi:hypothetical protein